MSIISCPSCGQAAASNKFTNPGFQVPAQDRTSEPNRNRQTGEETVGRRWRESGGRERSVYYWFSGLVWFTLKRKFVSANPLDGCHHVFIDLGSNRGLQIRKLYEPHTFPLAPIQPLYEKFFGKPEERNLQEICSVLQHQFCNLFKISTIFSIRSVLSQTPSTPHI